MSSQSDSMPSNALLSDNGDDDPPAAMYNTVELAPGPTPYQHSVWHARPSHQSIEMGTGASSSIGAELRADGMKTSLALLARMNAQQRFGTDTVIVHCLLTIWGIILFVRLGWIVANAGVYGALMIILIGFMTTMLTALSLSAICTNGDIGAGGTYTMIARTLGPSWGAAIGILFSFANSVSLALYCVGFAETLSYILRKSDIPVVTNSPINDVRLFGALVLVAVLALCLIGVEWLVKFDLYQLYIVILSMAWFIIGSVTSKADPSFAFTGYSASTLAGNLNPQFAATESFLTVFAVFFPAMTGMMSGASMSGDLKNPQISIPRGTISSIIISTFMYVLLVVIIGATVTRLTPSDINGLYHNNYIMADVSPWRWLFLMGILSSTFSSAVASIIVAPRILQAVCADGIFLDYFASGRKSDNEPIRGYLLSFAIGICFVFVGDINALAPLITNFFLANRTLVNFSVYIAHGSSPGWRPSWRLYHPLLSLSGAVVCVVLMFALCWKSALCISCLSLVIFKMVRFRRPDVTFGEYSNGKMYIKTAQAILDLQMTPLHVKNWRPSVMIATNATESDDEILLHFTDLIGSGRGLVFVATVVTSSFEDYITDMTPSPRGSPAPNNSTTRISPNTFAKPTPDQAPRCEVAGATQPRRISGESLRRVCRERVTAPTFIDGLRILLQTAGVSSLRPNVYMTRLSTSTGLSSNVAACDELVDEMWSALRMRYGVCVVTGHIERPLERSFLDVYWLADTGGLTLLLPHLLLQHRDWAPLCRIRLFLQGNQQGDFRPDSLAMIQLMKRFRIDVAAVHHIDLQAPPSPEAWSSFPPITNAAHRAKMSHYLRVGQSIRHHSNSAAAVFVTLPYPRRSLFTSVQLVQWLEAIVQAVRPPVILIRGNQKNVLTLKA